MQSATEVKGSKLHQGLQVSGQTLLILASSPFVCSSYEQTHERRTPIFISRDAELLFKSPLKKEACCPWRRLKVDAAVT